LESQHIEASLYFNTGSSIMKTAYRFVVILSVLCCNETLSADPPAPLQKSHAEQNEHPYFHKQEKEKPHAAEWSYMGETGPSHWGDLCPEYAVAKTGKQQSPIDIRGTLPKALPRLDFKYRPSQIHLIYNGHTIQENEDPGSFGIANDKFELQQFHFHAPSEHTVDGKHFPMEMHLVHKAQDGTSGVVAVLINEGEHNRAFDPVWDNLPDANQPQRDTQFKVDALSLLPRDTTYYSYDGSFTTPPCTEQVKWVILAQPVSLSKQQITRFREVIHDNNRPVQRLNGRQVFRSAHE
jgi:carbonic anhydrase